MRLISVSALKYNRGVDGDQTLRSLGERFGPAWLIRGLRNRKRRESDLVDGIKSCMVVAAYGTDFCGKQLM
eukprot:3507136-Pyramimonas_sp.AAC.1